MTPKSTRLMRLCCMLLLLFVGSMVFSQTKKISGKVTGSDGQPVPGATVAVKGTNAVTVTAADGTYTINAKPGDALVITSVGFKTQEIKVCHRARFGNT